MAMNLHKTVTVTLEPLHKQLNVVVNTPLIDVINEFGVEFPCGGKGICGACKVKLLSGNIAKDKHHSDFLDKLHLDESWRLACLSYVSEDITLEIAQWENVILADNTTFDFVPQTGFGVAIDLGTTTVVAQLTDLSNGSVAGAQSIINPQTLYGADVMSRIETALSDEGAAKLRKLIRDAVLKMIIELTSGKNVDLKKVVLVGNTAMQHIFCGLDVRPLSQYPFESPDLGLQKFTPSELGWPLDPSTEILFYPSLGGFVGSDILAGIVSAKIDKSDKLTALIDLGTNGEIVLGNKDGVLCASTAAGPAFEGTNISMGMRATTGAISAVSLENNILKAHTIGNVMPRGICGSGLIDAVANLLRLGKIDSSGACVNDEEQIEIESPVTLSQGDIREFQLAKGAIAAGLQVLANTMNKSLNDIDKLYIAGGFGHFINIRNVCNTGLIEIEEQRIVKLGNSALLGAKIFLFTPENDIEKTVNLCRHVSLDADAGFQNIFVEKMFF